MTIHTFADLKAADFRFPTVALFYGSNCKPCETLKPRLREECKKLNVRLEEFHINDNMAAARELGLRSVPTVLVVYKGDVKVAFQGLVPDIRARLTAAGVEER